jgi:predicted PurR-regulated permease PerM
MTVSGPLKKGFLPYLLFAAAVIIVYRVVGEFSYFFRMASRLWGIVTPFFYGFLLAYIINIPYGSTQKLLAKIKWRFFRRIYKPLSLIITLILFAAALLSALYLVIPYIYRSVSSFIANLPVYYESTLGLVDAINNLEFPGIYISVETILERLREALANLSLDNLLSSANALLAVPSAMFTAFLALISSIYILIEKDKFKKFLCRLLQAFIPAGACGAIIEYTGKLNGNFKRYIRVQTIDGLILGTIAGIELYILGSPFALILGIMLGVLNYIPYFGSIIGSAIAVVAVAFTQGLTVAAIAAAVLLITQQIDGNIIQPKLMGKSFSFSPLLVIISVTAGGAFAGIFGMIAAIPIAAVLKDILENITAHYERKKQ